MGGERGVFFNLAIKASQTEHEYYNIHATQLYNVIQLFFYRIVCNYTL